MSGSNYNTGAAAGEGKNGERKWGGAKTELHNFSGELQRTPSLLFKDQVGIFFFNEKKKIKTSNFTNKNNI